MLCASLSHEARKEKVMQPSRRKFLQDTSLLAAASLAANHGAAIAESSAAAGPPRKPPLQTPSSTRRGDMLYRKLGSTGEEISLIGIGGFHIGAVKDPL